MDLVEQLDITALATPHFEAGSSECYCADGSFPYHMTKADFQNRPATDDELARRESIYKLQAQLSLAPLIKPDKYQKVDKLTKLVHRFSPGIYCREFTMPFGAVIVSRRHAREHFCVISQGTVRVDTEHGSEILTAPCTFISHAGVKRVVTILSEEDVIWTNFHRTDACTLEEVERELLMDEIPEVESAITKVLDGMKLLEN